jgi:Calcineurin-like phosphoesterase
LYRLSSESLGGVIFINAIMKKKLFTFLPIFFISSILPDDRCSHTPPDNKNIAAGADGPYVLYKRNHVLAEYIVDKNGTMTVQTDSIAIEQKDNLLIKVATDEPGKNFSVKLKKKLQTEKNEYKKVDRQLVLSDIEGNFRPFRKLLQANGVIDTSFNWTFGDGHLVLVGDFFDRGDHVTEVLWLIYSLEEKAKAAGGYVHFVLGNHEIMNMSGDLRYVQPKYKENAVLLGERYEDLYGENSELGRWLRTKNVIEKVGDMLYLHGGISAQINSMDISIAGINELARPYYADSTSQYENKKTETIYGDNGPFWYRGYYKDNIKATPEQIDSTLSKFNIQHITTGHTMVADTISVWYRGKIFDTDVHHAAGLSEAMLIENGKYYRVNAFGEKFLMME